MKIAVIGAGVAGVTTAWELARDGHEVTVFERHHTAAEEGSFANSGLLAPAALIPWLGADMSWRVRRRMLARLRGIGSPLSRYWPMSFGEMAWLLRRRLMFSSTLAKRHVALRELARYSHERLHQLTAEFELDFERQLGVLLLLRTPREATQLRAGLPLLEQLGIPHKEIDSAQAREIEPALSADTVLHSAIHLPNDEAGNCRQFTLILKSLAQQTCGVKFQFKAEVARLTPAAHGQGMTVQLANETEERHFDAAVLCAGAGAGRLLRKLGLKLPMAAVHGYSISAQVREPLHAPRSAVVDMRQQMAISRLGNRVRVSGGTEIGGGRKALERQHPGTVQSLYRNLHDWFPGAAIVSSGVQTWKGAQIMLPDGVPLLGASGTPGLWLNCGHGHLGWTLACGAARVIGDLVAEQMPALDLQELSPARWQG